MILAAILLTLLSSAAAEACHDVAVQARCLKAQEARAQAADQARFTCEAELSATEASLANRRRESAEVADRLTKLRAWMEFGSAEREFIANAEEAVATLFPGGPTFAELSPASAHLLHWDEVGGSHRSALLASELTSLRQERTALEPRGEKLRAEELALTESALSLRQRIATYAAEAAGTRSSAEGFCSTQACVPRGGPYPSHAL